MAFAAKANNKTVAGWALKLLNISFWRVFFLKFNKIKKFEKII
jgi:hypothetical protein